MKRIEYLKTLDAEELSHLLCGQTECNCCPVYELCSLQGNGYKKWLSGEMNETQDSKVAEGITGTGVFD